ncbi:hypothetical protein E1B28_008794 [Marasmius oreades]|uniref:SET domain-containing protein n=1 Tax=Marasmius oreades TaxID=181124 RepID=A0A9P7RZ16_9AGAR|nr:uncharacterized protein E1B28_008794 [Marasmius oreades]KAG7092439.1 hypothetical protein E1B28_008794 [Marasmius oreades]
MIHPHWTQLLQWLDIPAPPVSPKESARTGYALVADRPLTPNQPLFTIDTDKILNIKTLTPLYPNHRLSATQLIALHLVLSRANKREFGPYVATLPTNFDFHPLSWYTEGSERALYLPPSHANSLKMLAVRFCNDREASYRYMVDSGLAIGLPRDEMNARYLWAWLCVNTRCIFHHLNEACSDPDNLSLVPILDFANHTIRLPSMTPQDKTSQICHGASRTCKAGSFTLLAPADIPTGVGEELYLKYGSHCNRVLFVEYGFVLRRSETEQPHCEVEVDDLVESMFEKQGRFGKWAKNILQAHDYWKDYTLHVAYPSFRLVTALRLHAMLLVRHKTIAVGDEKFLSPWLATITGQSDRISTEIESQWLTTLVDKICQPIITRAEIGLNRLRGKEGLGLDDVKVLWEEEMYIVQCICENVRNGGELYI